MQRKPKAPKESIFKGTLKWFVGVSLIIGITSIVLFWYVLELNNWSEVALEKARTMVFAFLVFEEIFFALSCKSLGLSLPKVGLFSNKFLLYSLIGESILMVSIMTIPLTMDLFGLVPLTLQEWIIIFVLSPIAFVYSELIKLAK